MKRTLSYTLSEAESVAWNHADPDKAQRARDEIVERVGKQAAAEDYDVFLVNDVGGRELGFGTTNPLRFLLKPMDLPSLEGLLHWGDARKTSHWPEGNPDYVEKLGLTEEHVPALIRAALLWADVDARPEGDAVYAPIHAWRALAQLGAVEAVEPLRGLTRPGRPMDSGFLGRRAARTGRSRNGTRAGRSAGTGAGLFHSSGQSRRA